MSIERFDNYFVLEKRFGPMTVGLFLKSMREADEIGLEAFAKKLKISRSNLCDIEKGRKLVSPERAFRFAKVLKVSEAFLIKLSLEDLLRSSKLHFEVEIKQAA